jgi:hypothetical protein
MISHGGSGGEYRNVVFRLGVEPDDKSRTTLANYGKQIADADKSLQSQLRRERAATAKAHESLLRDEERAAKQSNAVIERDYNRLVDRKRQTYVSLARQAREHSLAEQREAKASADARIAEEERVARAVRKAQGERLIAQKRAGRADRAALGSAFGSALSGVAETARGAAYFGLASESDSQAVLNTVLQVEGAMGIGRGLMDLGRAASTATGAISRLGAVTPHAVVALAAIASVKLGHELYTGNHGPGTASWYAGYGVELADRFGQSLNPGAQAVTTRDFLGMEQAQARTQQMTQAAIARRMERQQRIGLDERMRSSRLSALEMERAGIRQSVLLGDRNEWQASVADFVAAAGFRNDARRDRMSLGSTRDERWLKSAQAELDAQDRLLAARQEMHRLGLADKETRIAAANESITKAREELDIQKRITDTLRNRLTSAAERFGNLPDEDKFRTIEAMRRAKSGELLSREDRYLLTGTGLDEPGRLATQSAVAEAERFGFSKVFGAEEREQFAAANKMRRELTQQIAVQQDVKVNLEFNRDALKAMFRDQYRAQAAEIKELFQEVQREENNALWNEINNLKNKNAPPAVVRTDPKVQEESRMRW